MADTIQLTVAPREAKDTPKTLRKAGTVPGIVYGRGKKNVVVQCPEKDLNAVYVKAGSNTLVEIEVDGKKVPCLIHSLSFHPVTGKYEHVDFYAVDMTKKVTARVPVIVEGESPAVKNLGGVLLTVHGELEVTCLPSELPKNFTININVLENFHDSITVGKLKVPKGVVIKASPETVIISVQEPRKEEVIEAPVVAAAEGAVGAEGAPAEGAAAAPGAAPVPGAKAEAAPAKEKGKK